MRRGDGAKENLRVETVTDSETVAMALEMVSESKPQISPRFNSCVRPVFVRAHIRVYAQQQGAACRHAR